MDWNDKFSSIVRETEHNLARVKQRLNSAKSSASSSLSPPSIYNRAPLSVSTSRRVTFDQSLANGDDVNTLKPTRIGDLETSPKLRLDDSSSVSLFLHDQLNQQNKVIEDLKREVSRLKGEHEQDRRELRELRGELSQVHSRVVERGVDVQTERKMEQWRRDMAAEMQLVQSQVQSYRSSNDSQQYSTSQLQSALREIQDIKRYVMDEGQSVRREVDSLKTRLVKFEMDLTSLRTDSNEINRRHDRLDRNVREVSESQRSHRTDISRNNEDRDHEKLQIHELRGTVRSLRDKLSSMESHMHDSLQNKTPNKGLEKGKKKKKHSKKKSAYLEDDISSSSGLSTLSLADYSSEDFSFRARKPEKELNLDDLDLSDVPSLSGSDLDL